MNDEINDHLHLHLEFRGRHVDLTPDEHVLMTALRAVVRADRSALRSLTAKLETLRATPTTPLPQIDPGMIPAGCALPAFDGVEEAQMAARRG